MKSFNTMAFQIFVLVILSVMYGYTVTEYYGEIPKRMPFSHPDTRDS